MLAHYDRMEGQAEVPEFVRASDAESKQGNAALRGTAVHRVMECLDYEKLLNIDVTMIETVEKFLDDEIVRMLRKQLITEEMESLIYRKAIVDFLMSPVALRMARAHQRGDLYTEKPFVMKYEGVLLQGIIDVFWVEEDGIVLMDYKTDRVLTPQELLERYQLQLALYAGALSRIFGEDKLCREAYIYSFRLNELITVPIVEEK